MGKRSAKRLASRLGVDATSLGHTARKHLLGPAIKAGSRLAYLLAPVLPGRLPRLDRPIFVVGCSRSGTSVLVRTLAGHRDLANWSEAAQILDVDYYDPDVDHVKDEKDVTGLDAYRIRLCFGLFTRIRGKRRFVNKHPQNSLRVAYLRAIFPDALFVHVIRDGRAVVRSTLAAVRRVAFRRRYPFGGFPKPPRWREYLALPPAVQYACQWRDVVAGLREAACTSLPADAYVEVTYEEFCRATHETLRRLDDFCGLDPAGRDYASIPARLASRNTEWRSCLDAVQRDQIEAVLGECLAELGYG